MKTTELHIPVLLEESVQGLNLHIDSVVIDGTLGLGGHSEEILKNIPKGLLIGIDQDEQNIAHARKRLTMFSNLIIEKNNFRNLKQVLEKNNIEKVDAILLDIGISSTHVDDASRGFAFKEDGPLDMRMDTSKDLTAYDIVNTYSEEDLANIIYQYGEERQSRKIAKIICQDRKIKKIKTTFELKSLLERTIKNSKKHPALLVFQALRIEVNDELNALKEALKNAVEVLKPGGRIAVISFHSLEDRIVKQFFKEETKTCICPIEIPVCRCNKKQTLKIITKKPIIPSDKEIENNSRSRSSKLRIAERI